MRIYRSLIFAPLVLLALAACKPADNPVTETTIFEARTAYATTVLAPSAAYASLPACTAGQVAGIPPICSETSVVLKLQAADKAVQLAVERATAFVKANPKLDASSYIAAISSAVQTVREIQLLYGIKPK